MGVRALGAFSGGLDSMLAALVLRDQGIQVEAVTFESPFFGGERGRLAAGRIGIPWRLVDLTDRIMELLLDPPSGFGGHLNPCIDCHAAMFSELFSIGSGEGHDFVFSGEVLGQRPMSQNRGSLNRVARLSGDPGRLLRPLSARLLEPTGPERAGLVDRNRLLDISGRGRTRQIALAEKYGISYENPAGGCLLTEPGYTARLRVLLDSPGLLTALNARLARHGRMFRLGGGAAGLVGRSEADNARLEELADPGRTFVTVGFPGPTGVVLGSAPEPGVMLLCSLMVLYARKFTGAEAAVRTLDGREYRVAPADPETAESLLVKA
jgi:tRNA-specific 2-thiouridylase